MQWLYLILAITGAVVPFSFLSVFLSTHGFDIPELFRQLFQNNVSAAFGADVIISALALFLFIFLEGRRLRMRNLWAYVLCTLPVGVSFGLPLFLFFRQRRLVAGDVRHPNL
jgi:hypothetical protein